MVQVAECLPSNCKFLNSNPNTTKKREKKITYYFPIHNPSCEEYVESHIWLSSLPGWRQCQMNRFTPIHGHCQRTWEDEQEVGKNKYEGLVSGRVNKRNWMDLSEWILTIMLVCVTYVRCTPKKDAQVKGRGQFCNRNII
jgi:hypothetical protein